MIDLHIEDERSQLLSLVLNRTYQHALNSIRNEFLQITKIYSHIENSVAGEDIPPIKIVIVKGAEDITIKIADRG